MSADGTAFIVHLRRRFSDNSSVLEDLTNTRLAGDIYASILPRQSILPAAFTYIIFHCRALFYLILCIFRSVPSSHYVAVLINMQVLSRARPPRPLRKGRDRDGRKVRSRPPPFYAPARDGRVANVWTPIQFASSRAQDCVHLNIRSSPRP